MNSTDHHQHATELLLNFTAGTDFVILNNNTEIPEIHPSVLATCSALMLLTTVVGTPANTMICTAVAMSKTLRTSMNALIVNLSIADLINCTVCSTLMVVAGVGYVAHEDISETLCHTLDSFHVLGGSVQLITIGSISLERYQALYKPFEKKYVVTRIKISLVASWTVGLICMITAWTFFQDSPTLLLCDRTNREDIVKHLSSYRLGIYIFVPLTFLSVLIIVVFYVRILYLVQLHVKSTEKTLGSGGKGGKKIKKNKVAPRKETTKSIKEAMINNFMPPGFSIIDNDIGGSRISLAGLAKDETNNDKGAKVSLMDAYKEPNNAEDKNTSKENDQVTRTENGKVNEAANKVKEARNISSISQKVDILPTVYSVSSLNRNSSGKELKDSHMLNTQEPTVNTNSQILSVQRLESGKFQSTTNGIKEHTTNTDANNDTHQQGEGKHQRKANATTANDSGFSEIDNTVHQETINDHQGERTTTVSHVNSRKKRDLEYRELELGNLPNQLGTFTDETKTISKADTFSFGNDGSLIAPDKDGTNINILNKARDTETNEATYEYRGNEGEKRLDMEPHHDISDYNSAVVARTNDTQFDASKVERDIKVKESATREIEITEINTKLDSPNNAKSTINESADDITAINYTATRKLKTGKQVGGLKPKMSIVQIYDADGLTVKAKTSRQSVTGDICVINNSNKIKGKRKLEAKSAKRAAVVLVTFLIAWLPFPIVIVVSWYSQPQDMGKLQALTSVYVVSMTLSLLAAAVNPLVYGAINKQFYKEFRKMFKRCKQGCTKKLKR